MSRILQDQFIDDDDEETCPLCVEELDLSDRGFRPCPCGYQICQFCYHNVRNNLNGLCPACRRPYDDKTIDFRKPSAEEEAAFRARQMSRQKRTVAAAAKEVLKREADTLNRKHLAGLRVVQKNLVYVTGLNPSVQEDKLLETLRGPQYFGQYGKIIKIVVSKAKDNQASVGVYVTYARKEDAIQCINAVDGSANGERTLRAQFGTTKYCSAYLRNEQCQNRNCMFLHEPGEEKDSFTRQDLSSMNVASTQQHQSPYLPSHPPPQPAQPVAAAARPDSTAPMPTPSEAAAGPALPSSASWASKPHPPSRSVSRAAAAAASPALTNATTVSSSIPEAHPPQPSIPTPEPAPKPQQTAPSTPPPPPAAVSPFASFVERIFSRPFPKVAIDTSSFSEEERRLMDAMPLLFDVNGGKKRRLVKDRQAAEESRRQLAQGSAEEASDQVQGRGSLQLGGEPETEQGPASAFSLETDLSQLSLMNRGVTPSQQPLSQGFRSSTPSQAGSTQFAHQMGQANAPGHARNASRFSFANDTSSTTAVKPVADPKLMNQQSAMMPPQTPGSGAFGQQSSFYSGTVSGPPPGLKTTGTPPVSGGGMFAQGHGFATGGLGYGSNMASRNSNDEMLREIYRRREAGGQDGAKQPSDPAQDPFVGEAAQHGTSFAPRLPATEGRATPPVPPGLEGLGHSMQSPGPAPGNAAVAGLDAIGTPVRVPVPDKDHATPSKSQSGPKAPVAEHKTATKSAAAKPAALSTSATRETLNASAIPAAAENAKVAATKDGQMPSKAELPSQKADKSGKPAADGLKTEQSQQNAPNSTQQPAKMVQEPAKPITMSDIASAQAPSAPLATPVKTPWQMVASERVPSPSPSAGLSLDPTPSEAKKRQHPGKIDLGTPVPLKGPLSEISSRLQSPAGTPPASRPASPAVDASVKKRAQVIRLVSTPKPEPTPPPKPEAAPVMTFPSAVPKIPSRAPSIASALIPGTPVSEGISDTISVASTSMSRPASPPPQIGTGIVGSAAVRAQTKSQAKKARQERAKALEEKEKPAVPVPEPEVQEAIVGRKKKTKKPAPPPKPKVVTESAAPSPRAGTPQLEEEKPSEPTPPVLQEESPQQAPEEEEPSEPQTPVDPVATLIADLRASSDAFSAQLNSMLRPLSQTRYQPTMPITPADIPLDRPFKRNPELNLGPDQLAQLAALHPLKYGGEDGRVWTHGCITPAGAHLRHLEPEMEEAFLALEESELVRHPSERYHHIPVTSLDTELPRLDLAAMRRDGGPVRPNNAMEKAVEEGSKKGSFLVGNAEEYIDEFVMPVRGGTKAEADRARDELGDVGKRDLGELERMLKEARKDEEQKAGALQRAIRKTRKLVGLDEE